MTVYIDSFKRIRQTTCKLLQIHIRDQLEAMTCCSRCDIGEVVSHAADDVVVGLRQHEKTSLFSQLRAQPRMHIIWVRAVMES